MADYTNKTDAELDALAAERMGRKGSEPIDWSNEDTVPVLPFMPTTDANDRDEWVEWLRAQELAIHVNTLLDGGWRAEMYTTETMGPTTTVDAVTLGRAVLIAGLRATDA